MCGIILTEFREEACTIKSDNQKPKPNSTKPKKKPLLTQKPKKEKGEGTQTNFKNIFENKYVRALTALFCVGVMVMSIVGVAAAAYLIDATKDDDALLNLNNIKLSFTTIIYDRYGNEYQRLTGEEHRIWVNLNDMNPMLPLAFLAVEDDIFEKHSGVNWKRTIGATLNYALDKVGLGFWDTQQGGSTITQQLIKNLTMDDDQDALRKLREIYRALVLEKQYSKEMIMEAYLNTLRLTGQNAGVESGANIYFGKHVDELTLAECASLAAITRNPTAYNPFTNPEAHTARRDYILLLMHEQGYITKEEMEEAIAEPLNLSDGTSSISQRGELNSYFTDAVIEEVITDLMAAYDMTRAEATDLLYNGGLRINSTVEPTLQAAMEAELIGNVNNAFPQNVSHMVEQRDENGNLVEVEEFPQAAMISLSYDGGIAACVGGLGEKPGDRVFNRAIDAVRPNGSTMKPIGAYALGIDYGFITYSSAFMDSPFQQIRDPQTGVIRDWPRNYSGQYAETEVLVYDAIARSLNTIAVKAGDQVGPRAIFDFLEGTLHVDSLVSSGPVNDMDLGPLVLGSLTEGISPAQLAGCYMMFGNGGQFSTIHSYTTVLDSNDNIILEKRIVTTQAISPETAYIMNRALYNVLHGGTANGLYSRTGPSVGKTGTTSDNKDHWFIGLTPLYVTATWWGYDTQDALTVNYNSHPPTTAWRNVMDAAQADLTAEEIGNFPTCSTVQRLTFCATSGDLAGPACPEQREGYYAPIRTPGTCIWHG